MQITENNPVESQKVGAFVCAPSFAQQRLWFMNQLDPETSAYNVALTFRVLGPLNSALLERALAAVVQRHESLRTTFEIVDSELVQIVSEDVPFAVEMADLQGVPEEAREAAAQHALTEATRRPFNLETGPLFRAALWRLGPEEHVLMLNMHHIVSDGWSFNVLRRDMGAIYESLVTGEMAALPELTIQYPDYAQWQRDWLHGEVLDRQFDYWKEQVGDLAPVLNIPTDYPRPSVRSSDGAVQRILIPATLVSKIKSLCETAGCTTYTAYLTAFKTLLHRFSGQTDIWVGSPVAGRTQQETENLIGCFINTLVLRTDLSEEPSLIELLKRVRNVVVDGFIHQDMPFEVLVDKLNVVRDRSRNPLFQAMIIDSSNFVQPLEVGGLRFEPLLIERGASMVDMTLFLVGSGDGLKVGLEYSTDLFEHQTATRFLKTYLTLLESAVADPTQSIAALSLLDESERNQLIVDWNDTESAYPKDLGVHQLVELQANQTPDAIAAIFESEQLTYGELNARAEALAQHLTNLGVGRDVRVGLYVERSLDMLIGLLGIAKAGGAYVPLDPDYPPKRIEYILQDAQAPVLVTQSHLVERLPEHSAQLVVLDQELPAIPAGPTGATGATHSCGEDLAYVIYTSGSTGNPKGVQISHRALINLLCSMQKTPGLAQTDTLAAVTTLCFDIAGLELWLPLITGAKVVIASRDVTMDGDRLAALLENENVTVMQATPATWRLLLESGWKGRKDLKVLCGGEALPLSLAQSLRPICGSLWNVYGPTETTIWSTVLQVEETNSPLTIGRPIANTQIYIVDANFEPTPIGVPGELCIGGDGLARGYLNRPELTEEKFVRNPFRSDPDSRLYRTGDLARYLANGNIDFLGRLDHQVKIRGFRIELGEIESRLREHPSIRQVVVVAREEGSGDRRLVAYMVGTDTDLPDIPALRTFIKETLPDYMTPSDWVWLDELPQTANGKIDKNALPEPERERIVVADEDAAPRTATEARLVPIWESVLKVTSIAVTDDFFDLGGHSLVAVRLFAQIERAFNTRLPLSSLFQAPTIRQLAARLEPAALPDAWSTLVPINTSGNLPAFFCVHAVGANVLNYRLLSKSLGENQPFYGFQAQGLDGTLPAHNSVEEMAAHYVRELIAVQPRGPYYIGGASWGGTVAFEMAHQLTVSGERVALVALLDTMLMGHQVPERLDHRSVAHFRLRLIDRHVGTVIDLPFREQVRFLVSSLANKVVLKLRALAGHKGSYTGEALSNSITNLKEMIVESMRRYQPPMYSGRVAMFLAENAPDRTRVDLRLLWGEYCEAGLEVYAVPGDHADFLDEPHVELVAARLRGCLKRTVEAEAFRRAA